MEPANILIVKTLDTSSVSRIQTMYGYLQRKITLRTVLKICSAIQLFNIILYIVIGEQLCAATGELLDDWEATLTDWEYDLNVKYADRIIVKNCPARLDYINSTTLMVDITQSPDTFTNVVTFSSKLYDGNYITLINHEIIPFIMAAWNEVICGNTPDGITIKNTTFCNLQKCSHFTYENGELITCKLNKWLVACDELEALLVRLMQCSGINTQTLLLAQSTKALNPRTVSCHSLIKSYIPTPPLENSE